MEIIVLPFFVLVGIIAVIGGGYLYLVAPFQFLIGFIKGDETLTANGAPGLFLWYITGAILLLAVIAANIPYKGENHYAENKKFLKKFLFSVILGVIAIIAAIALSESIIVFWIGGLIIILSGVISKVIWG